MAFGVGTRIDLPPTLRIVLTKWPAFISAGAVDFLPEAFAGIPAAPAQSFDHFP